MLNSRQSWRRRKSSRVTQNLKHNAEYKRDCSAYSAYSDISVPTSASKQCMSTSSESLSSPASSSGGRRRVKFSPVIRVCLVPCRSDFLSDFHSLFWMREDYQSFKEDAVRELRAHWLTNRTTVKEAIIDLYQPSIEDLMASKTLMSHVDSVAQLRLPSLQLLDAEPNATQTPIISLKPPAPADHATREETHDQVLPYGSMSCGSVDSFDMNDAADLWVPSPLSSPLSASPTNDPQHLEEAAAHQHINPLVLPLTPNHSCNNGTLLGQVTGPHIDLITPMRSESADTRMCPAATSSSSSSRSNNNNNNRNKPPQLLQIPLLQISTPMDMDHAPLTTSSSENNTNTGNNNNNNNNNSCSTCTSNNSSNCNSARGESSKSDNLRLILLDESSPTSSLSSFETPIMIFGQS